MKTIYFPLNTVLEDDKEFCTLSSAISEDLLNRYNYDLSPIHCIKIYYTAIAAARKVINDTFLEYRNSKVYKLKGHKSIDLYIYKEGKHKNGLWRYSYVKPNVDESNIVDAYEDDLFSKAFSDILINKFGAELDWRRETKELMANMISSCVYAFAIETVRYRSLFGKFHFGFVYHYKKYSYNDKYVYGDTVSLKFLAADGIEANLTVA